MESVEKDVIINEQKKQIYDYFVESSWQTFFTIICITLCGIIYSLWKSILRPFFCLISVLKCNSALNERSPKCCFTQCKRTGIIREYRCPKTERTYCIRYFDRERDINDAAALLSSGFAKDPFNIALFDTVNKKHLFTAPWHHATLLSPSVEVIVQEWVEEEKLTGVIIFSDRPGNTWSSMIDVFFLVCFFIEYLGYFSIKDMGRMILVTLNLSDRFYKMCETYGNNLGIIKFLCVEKGFQGQGIGSSLLKSVTDIFDSKKMLSYLESSNVKNLGLYKRFQYEHFENYYLIKNFPPLYLMLRQPQSIPRDLSDKKAR
jgi:ribosomal protein S18 acetylase RimI-like enzyme